MSDIENGKIEILHMAIARVSRDGVEDIVSVHDMFIQCSFTESIFGDFIFGTITLVDGKGLLTRFNKVGFQAQEILFIKARSKDKEPFNLQFAVGEVTNIEFSNQSQSSSFTLALMSYESIIDMNASVNQAFQSTYSKAAEKIFENYIEKDSRFKNIFVKRSDIVQFNKPKLDVHDSIGAEKFIVPGQQPLEALEFCARRSINTDYRASVFISYQSISGFNFHNLEKLIEDGVKEIKSNRDLVFRYASTEEDQSSTPNVERKIKTFQSVDLTNSIDNTTAGVYRNTVRSVDMIRKTIKDFNFIYEKEHVHFKKLGPKKLVDNKYLEDFTRSNYEYLLFKDSSKPNQRFEAILGRRMPFVLSLNNIKVSFLINGDSTLKCGKVIEFDIPEMSAFDTKAASERSKTKFSGYWLIESVTHSFGKDTYNCVVSVLKDSIVEAMG